MNVNEIINQVFNENQNLNEATKVPMGGDDAQGGGEALKAAEVTARREFGGSTKQMALEKLGKIPGVPVQGEFGGAGTAKHMQKMKDEEFKKNFAKLGNAGPGTGGSAALKAGQKQYYDDLGKAAGVTAQGEFGGSTKQMALEKLGKKAGVPVQGEFGGAGTAKHMQKMKDEEFKKNFAKLGNAGPGTGGSAALKAGQKQLAKDKEEANYIVMPPKETDSEETQTAKASFLSKLAKTAKNHAPELGAGAAALGLGAGALALMRKRKQVKK